MRRALHQRFGAIGLGEADPQPRPVAGSLHVAGGFIIPALLGAEIRFSSRRRAPAMPLHWTPEQIDRLEKPDFRAPGHAGVIAGWDAQEAEYGYLVGDLNTDGMLNAAYHFYGQDLFADFYDAPERVRHALQIVADLIVDVALYVRCRTGSCSIAVNRMVERVNPSLFLHANCSVQMISPRSYRPMQMPVEQTWRPAAPFGVHHCGDNMHPVAAAYAELGAVFAMSAGDRMLPYVAPRCPRLPQPAPQSPSAC